MASRESGLDLSHLLDLEAQQLPAQISRPLFILNPVVHMPFSAQVLSKVEWACRPVALFSCLTIFKPHKFKWYKLWEKESLPSHLTSVA